MDVQPYYQGIVDAFVKFAKNSGFKVVSDRVVLTPLEVKGEACWDLALKNSALVLKGDVSSGAGNGLAKTLGFATGEFRILIGPREVIKQGDPWNIRRSTVELAYVAADSSKPNPHLLLGLHYDFAVSESGDPEHAHPVFHAQLTDRLLQLRDALGQQVEVNRMQYLPSVRLPTAHMSFPSVLLGVAADNFKPDHFNGFLRVVRKDANYPIMANPRFGQRITAHRHGMRSCAWYAN